MSEKNYSKEEFVKFWIKKSDESLSAAEDELKAGRLSFTVNRIYYACFYIVSALLLLKGLKFKKHSGVKASLHRNLIKRGLIGEKEGRFYNKLFEARQRGDYIEFVHFEKEQVEEWLQQANEFVKAVRALIK